MRPHERLFLGAQDFFEDNLDDYIDAVNADAATVYAFPHIAEWSKNYKQVLNTMRHPVASVFLENSTPAASANDGIDLSMRINLLVTVQVADPANLTTALLRLADAVTALIGENETLGGICLTSEIQFIADRVCPPSLV